MGGDRQHPQRTGRIRIWPAGAVFCNGRVPLGSQLSGTAKTGVRLAAFYPVSAGKSGGRFVAGADNCYL